MPRGRPRQPRASHPVPVRLALIDDKGQMRALADNFSAALDEFAKLNSDNKTDPAIEIYLRMNAVSHAEQIELKMMDQGWTIQRLTQEWLPRTDGVCVVWSEDLRPKERDGGLLIRL